MSTSRSKRRNLRRMIGKELDGMSYAELYVLGFDITSGAMKVMEERRKIKHAARVSKESIFPVQM
ncbi:hypothetical protein Bca4012_081970 [Brassica carinata]|uniref:Uncharacterized protein n=1 Tax=Brassica carinata TaxID=52824 RepID=A0A8X7VCZ7_BRACI|nr:hypothetical protein Bca52824_028854 [Brassica carinata]